MSDPFPFVAIVGLEQAKRSLLYHALDPRLGGILLQGHRGCAKSTLARAFAPLLQQLSDAPVPFVEVPLGTTEDRLLGSVNADQLVKQNQWQLKTGLLAQAHGGILYIDEVNLLPDHLTDSLLDAAASGQQQIERDGISASLPARFILVGSMNPEEGELRSQLLDRFAHKLRIHDEFEVSERTEIVRRRMEFEDHPTQFGLQFQSATTQLLEQLKAGRAALPQVAISEDSRRQVAEQARALKLEGLRTEIAILRTARCAAAWQQKGQVEETHLQEAWELCLGQSPSPPKSAPPPAKEPQSSVQGSRPRWQTARQPHQSRPDGLTLPEPSSFTGTSQPWQPSQPNKMVAPQIPLPRVSQAIDWLATLRHSWRGSEQSPHWSPRYAHSQRRRNWWLLMDASRSTGATTFLSEIRDRLKAILREHRRDRFDLLVLQQGQVTVSARRATSRQTMEQLDRLQEASGGSDLKQLLSQGRMALQRRGVGVKDRLLFASDGLFQVQDRPLSEEQKQFRREWQRLLQLGIVSRWWHPTPQTGMGSWISELSQGLALSTEALGSQ